MDPLAHRTMIAQVQVERQRLLPEHEEATQTTIDMLRTSTGRDDPASVPYLNLAYLLGVKNTYGDDKLMALALSVANWATTAINDSPTTPAAPHNRSSTTTRPTSSPTVNPPPEPRPTRSPTQSAGKAADLA
ncbi:hypothetical protein [Streptomyces sp. NPDC005078]|uniref:hypothetical protein n=1 Tax=unclassified Streptomyces TaxID=2593676 RepID=UPI0033ABF861